MKLSLHYLPNFLALTCYGQRDELNITDEMRTVVRDVFGRSGVVASG